MRSIEEIRRANARTDREQPCVPCREQPPCANVAEHWRDARRFCEDHQLRYRLWLIDELRALDPGLVLAAFEIAADAEKRGG